MNGNEINSTAAFSMINAKKGNDTLTLGNLYWLAEIVSQFILLKELCDPLRAICSTKVT